MKRAVGRQHVSHKLRRDDDHLKSPAPIPIQRCSSSFASSGTRELREEHEQHSVASRSREKSRRSHHVLPGEVRDVRQVHVGRLRPPRGVRPPADPRRPALCLPQLAWRGPGRRRRRRGGDRLVHLLVLYHVMGARIPCGGGSRRAQASLVAC
ncbi:hypothetical protein PR202_gb11444 [Eleusine coracana subsp. coracana]|uniref:Uncharacterized protein n=1 Tax=Eleusine coracana subsp. coracana TaxID=191504 RepID=A0AAV5EM35_ELECO|nr:hypothetical protein PR202_gb11444 [Eleusine coracana subsp. coracana]